MDLTNAKKKNDAMRGFSFSLSHEDDVYNSEEFPVLYKDINDEFKLDFFLKPNNNNRCFAQNVITMLSFNLKKDDTSLFGNHKAELIASDEQLQKHWQMMYDPFGEYENNGTINIGETYFTEIPKVNRKSFWFSPAESRSYSFTFIKGDSRNITYRLTQDGKNVSSQHGFSGDGYDCVVHYLEKGKRYKLSFLTINNTNSNLCQFRIDYTMINASPYAENNTCPTNFEVAEVNSVLYSFSTYEENEEYSPKSLREPYLLQTLKNDPYEYPDTYIELLDSRFNPIMFSDKPMATQGGAGRVASIIMPLKPNKQYYVSVQVRTMLHAKEKVQFRIVKERELGVFDPDRPITYKFSLTRDNPVICYHLLSKTAGEYQFMIFGNNYDALDIDIQIPAGMNVKNQEKTNYSKGYSIMSCNLASPMTYFIFIYSKDPLNVPVNEFEFRYWRVS